MLEGFITTEPCQSTTPIVNEYHPLHEPCAQSLTTIHRLCDRSATHLAHLAVDSGDVSLRYHGRITEDVVAPTLRSPIFIRLYAVVSSLLQ